MNPIFTKLNYKDQSEVAVVNAPDAFLPALETMRPLATIVTDPALIQTGGFILAFVKTQQEVDTLTEALAAKVEGDGLLWFAYPKGTSKRHQCEFNRDTGWAELGKQGFEGVRQVAIDEDWSALRFRRAEYIKKMTRQASRAMSEHGKKRVAP
ncbi:hypothetical protein [Spirosoma montaniterrae]|uniref:DUF3052 domain-containing protein n=1 Tax=Spirosoma montaniterrae TaxID=1178516 RepID=A0A1P9X2I2_9BACT|nr:hypothetical protein [Spirosoma montaniterrae]AQG81831.1 hypothetical protein AWR27_22515 [Spirosoma montaniterrae]